MEASGHTPEMSEPIARRRRTFKSLLRGVVSGIRQRTDATPPAPSRPAAYRGETGSDHDFVPAASGVTGHGPNFVPLSGAALPPPAATRAALALARDQAEDLRWSKEMRGVSAALGYTDSFHCPHFILNGDGL